MNEGEGKGFDVPQMETVIEELAIDTTIHPELIQEVASVYNRYYEMFDGKVKMKKDLCKIAGYLTIAYMVRRLSVKDLPLNKEKRTRPRR